MSVDVHPHVSHGTTTTPGIAVSSAHSGASRGLVSKSPVTKATSKAMAPPAMNIGTASAVVVWWGAKRRCSTPEIAAVTERTMNEVGGDGVRDLEDVKRVDAEARRFAREVADRLGATRTESR